MCMRLSTHMHSCQLVRFVHPKTINLTKTPINEILPPLPPPYNESIPPPSGWAALGGRLISWAGQGGAFNCQRLQSRPGIVVQECRCNMDDFFISFALLFDIFRYRQLRGVEESFFLGGGVGGSAKRSDKSIWLQVASHAAFSLRCVCVHFRGVIMKKEEVNKEESLIYAFMLCSRRGGGMFLPFRFFFEWSSRDNSAWFWDSATRSGLVSNAFKASVILADFSFIKNFLRCDAMRWKRMRCIFLFIIKRVPSEAYGPVERIEIKPLSLSTRVHPIFFTPFSNLLSPQKRRLWGSEKKLKSRC